jgi:hypothetical protein
MTKFNGLVEEDQSQFGPGKQRGSGAVPSRWIILLFGILAAVVLGGYLITGHSSMSDVLRPRSAPLSPWHGPLVEHGLACAARVITGIRCD